MKVTHFSRAGFPLALGGWSTGIVSVNSNFNTVDGGLNALNFVQAITANGSNQLLRPIVNFAAGSNITLSIDAGPLNSIPSNTIRIHSTGSGGNILTANGSNSLAAVVNLVAGSGIALGVTAQDVTITNTGSGGGGGGGASGAMVLLEQHTASASAQLDFTTFITSTYDTYQFEFINIIPASDGAYFRMLAGTGGGPTYDTGANYDWALWRFFSAGSGTQGTNSASEIVLVNTFHTLTANWSINGMAQLYNPGGAIYKTLNGKFSGWDNAAGAFLGTETIGVYMSTTAMTAVRFSMNTGNISSGIIRAYGITKT